MAIRQGLPFFTLAAIALSVSASQASGIISNGTVSLGVDDYGQLNIGGPASAFGVTSYGLRYDLAPFAGYEATANGCLCEGWGVGIGETGVFGAANNAVGGIQNLTADPFVTNGTTTATTVARLTTGQLEVTHDFAPSSVPDLYKVTVTIKNTSGVAISDLRYTRTFDFDVDPTAFAEYMTIGGSAAATDVILAIDNGFEDSNPFDPRNDIVATGDFVDNNGFGPQDNGANFDFGFGALGIDEEFTFDIFYGASLTETGALVALNAVGAEVYSLGQNRDDPAGTGEFGPTFIFGFAGVGGVVVPPVPVPAAIWLMVTGLGALGGIRGYKKLMGKTA